MLFSKTNIYFSIEIGDLILKSCVQAKTESISVCSYPGPRAEKAVFAGSATGGAPPTHSAKLGKESDGPFGKASIPRQLSEAWQRRPVIRHYHLISNKRTSL